MTAPTALIARPRLLSRLRSPWKIAVLSAPAGYGKTTLATQFVLHRRALWCRLQEEDRNPSHLLGTLIAAGARLSPPLCRRTFGLFRSRRDMERDGGVLFTSLLSELAPMRGERIVVIDDVHVLSEARAGIRWLRRLVEESGPHVRFLLTCRGECPLPLARLELSGGCLLLRTADLEFTEDEQARLLRALGVRAGSAERAGLAEALGGWAAGLVLAGQKMRDSSLSPSPHLSSGSPAPHLCASRPEDAGGLLGFLAEEVLAALPPALQKDLCRLALIQDLDRESIRALFGRARGDALLREITRRELFVRTLPDGADTLRFHPLFRTFLRGRFDKEFPASERRRVISGLARHWRARRVPERAVRVLVEGGLHDEAVRLFESCARSAYASGDHEWLPAAAHELLASGGGAVKAGGSPWFRLNAALHARDLGRLEEAASHARLARHAFLEERDPLMAARSYGVEANVALMTGHWSKPLADAGPLLESIGRKRAPRGIVLRHAGELSLYAGEPVKARAMLEEAVNLLHVGGHRIDEAEAVVRRAAVAYSEGCWDVYLQWAQRALPLFRQGGYAGRAESLLINMAEAWIYLGEEDRALAHLQEAERLNAGSGLLFNRTYEALGRARAFAEQGRRREAQAAFEAARAAAGAFGPAIAFPQIDVWEAILERRSGRCPGALARLDRAAESFERLDSPSWLALARMERGLVLGLMGRMEEGLAELKAAARSSRKLGDRKELARNALYEARVQQVAGKPFDAAARRSLRALLAENHLVALRQESDVAKPLLAACGARDRRLALRVVAGLPSEFRACVAGKPREREEARRASSTPPVAIRMLGGFELRVHGRAAAVERRAAEVLIAYLALHRSRHVSRETLAEALWPGADPRSSKNRFDVTLNAARHALEPEAEARGPFSVLLAEGGVCRLAEGKVTSDVEEFEKASGLCEKGGDRPSKMMRAIRTALALYAGELLPATATPWVEAERERLRERAHSLLLKLAGLSLAARRHDDAIEASRRVLADDPSREEAVRLLMRAHAARHDRASALRTYDSFARRLRREMGASPSPETRQLALELGTHARADEVMRR